MANEKTFQFGDHDYNATTPTSSKKTRKSYGRQCCAFNCNSYQYAVEGGERISTNIGMFCFPQCEKEKKLWCRLIKREENRDGFKITESTRVCSLHFLPIHFKPGGKRLDRKQAKPVLHAWNNFSIEERKRRKPSRVTASPSPIATTSTTIDNSNSAVCLEEKESVIDFDISDSPPPPPSKIIHDSPTFVTSPEDVHVEDSSNILDQQQKHTPCMVCQDYIVKINHLNLRVVELESEVATLQKEVDNKAIKQQFKARILSDDEECNHNTGFPTVDRLLAYYEMLDPGENGENMLMARSQNKVVERRPRALSPLEGFLLFLCRIRRGFSMRHLCFLFAISMGTVNSTFSMWLSFTYLKCASISWWPSKDTVIRCMPNSMKEKFPTVRVILDCAEFPAENPSSLQLQKLFYSSYKSRVTLKVLLGIMPGGGFTFVSAAYPGSISDRDIVIKSGILNPGFYEQGDSIMVDRGFTIQDLVEPMGVNLIIPSFLQGRSQLSPEEIVLSQQIASERIHVERMIQRLKTYKILDCIPVNLFGSANEILTVCCCLSNMQNPIIAN